MSTTTIGSSADRALDAATKGRTGKARPGFHLVFVVTRGVTRTGTPSASTTAERCTCATNGNHGATAVAR